MAEPTKILKSYPSCRSTANTQALKLMAGVSACSCVNTLLQCSSASSSTFDVTFWVESHGGRTFPMLNLAHFLCETQTCQGKDMISAYIKEYVNELVLCELFSVPVFLLILPAVPDISIKWISFSLLNKYTSLLLQQAA